MHIKRVTLSGFKSYKEQLELENFSPHHNVIVGRNGSGKSNFFDAICFVLSDRYTNLSQEQRQQLLHEGTGASVITAFVEVVFDNSDGRFPLKSDEVTLRRTIGLKKDEYFLNRRRVQKRDVLSYLESAGFSRSNPYYIVQQGKVNTLALMSDRQRLDLLKEVAGTRLYEEKRAGSIRIMEETDANREKITEYVQVIENRLQELETEKKELAEHQALDRQRRAAQYTLYDKELHASRADLEHIEMLRASDLRQSQTVHDEISRAADERATAIDAADAAEGRRITAAAAKSAAEAERAGLEGERTQLELQKEDLESEVEEEARERARLAKDLAAVSKEAAILRQELRTKAGPSFDAAARAKTESEELLARAEARVRVLLEKEGGGGRFKNVRERDAFLENEAQQLRSEAAAKGENIKAAEAAAKKHEATAAALETSASVRATTVAGAQQALLDVKRQNQELKAKRTKAVEDRKAAWKAEADAIAAAASAASNEAKGRRALRSLMPKALAQGVEAVMQIARERGWLFSKTESDLGSHDREHTDESDGMDVESKNHHKGMREGGKKANKHRGKVHGLLGSLFTRARQSQQDLFRTAVEATAGNALFNIVVDDDSVAAALLRELRKRNLGRVTFMPLNQLRPPSTRAAAVFRKVNKDQAIPLVTKLRFHRRYTRAMHQLFGKTLLCRGLEVATQLAREHDMDCVTLDGDQVSRRGALKGGYRGSGDALGRGKGGQDALSRLQALALLEQARVEHGKRVQQERNAKVAAAAADRAVTLLQGEALRLEGERQRQAQLAQEEEALSVRERDDAIAERQRAELRRREAAAMRRGRDALLDRAAEALSELGTALRSNLTNEQQQELSTLQAPFSSDDLSDKGNDRSTLSIAALAAQVAARTSAVDTARTVRDELQARLESNLCPREKELTAQIWMIDHGGRGSERPSTISSRSSISSISSSQRSSTHLPLRERLAACVARLTDVMSRSEEAAAAATTASAQLASADEAVRQALAQRERAAAEFTRLNDELSAMIRQSDKLLSKRTLMRTRVDEYSRKIRELGSLPTAQLSALKDKRKSELLAEISRCNEGLKSYANVNLKALQHFVNFSEQREDLMRRKRQMDEDSTHISDLIQALDRRKDEAIMRTFRDVKRHFSEIFEELVPGGRGELVLLTRMPESESTSGNDRSGSIDENVAALDVSLYEGIAVRVSFNVRPSPTNDDRENEGETEKEIARPQDGTEVMNMAELSGGQKALVALAIIFAIQRADPAPFYLFDEIDQALDMQHRQAVARLITRQCRDTNTSPSTDQKSVEENEDIKDADMSEEGEEEEEEDAKKELEQENTGGAQFITSTFRPELVEVADKFFGVSFQHRISQVHTLTKQQALQFIKDLQQVEEAALGSSTDATSQQQYRATPSRNAGRHRITVEQE